MRLLPSALLGPVIVALLAAGCGGGGSPALPEGRSLAARAGVSPPVALFGDPIVAQVEVLVDGDELDPGRILFEPEFAPYEILGDPTVERRNLGRYAQIRYTYTLRCITLDCIPLVGGGPAQPQPGGIPPPPTGSGGFGERKTIQLKSARLRYDDPEGGERVLRRVSWPSLQSVSRLNLADPRIVGIGFPFRASVTPLPEATFRVFPWLLGGGLLLLAAALLAVPGILLARALRRPPQEVVEEVPEVTPLERALALVEWARNREDGADRRKALEVLAGELDAEGRTELAEEGRRLAWSPASPTPEAADRLVELVREDDGSSA